MNGPRSKNVEAGSASVVIAIECVMVVSYIPVQASVQKYSR